MTFRLEAEMLQPASRWLEDEGLLTKAEFPTPWGVCDLVGASLNEAHARRRLELQQRQPLGPITRISILERIPDTAEGTFITLQRLEREFAEWLSPADLRKELDRLFSGKFVVSPRRNAYQKTNGWFPLHERIVAIELKIDRIEDAIKQAKAHLRFTKESYVGLPGELAQRIAEGRRRETFERFGIGLLAVADERCEVLIRPIVSTDTVDRLFQIHCTERFWIAWLKGSSS